MSRLYNTRITQHWTHQVACRDMWKLPMQDDLDAGNSIDLDCDVDMERDAEDE